MRVEEFLRLTKYDIRCIRKAIEYIDKHYSDNLSAENLSIEVSISIKKLHAGMQHETGFTLHDYVLKVRIEKSKSLLSDSNLPIKAISYSVGFKTPSHFGEVFRRFANLTPSEYRMQAGN